MSHAQRMLAVSSVSGNRQRLDGGAMFGNAPRAVWQRWCSPDELGRIDLSCRAFLVEDGERRILIETGVGAFFAPEMKERFGVLEEEHVLLQSLAERGLSPEDIDVVLLSHLHFDHAGGLLTRYEVGRPPRLAFPRARFVVSRQAWDRACAPHPRDRASFIPELPGLLESSQRLTVLEGGARGHELLGRRISLLHSQGHTPGMLLPCLQGRSQKALFCADLVPGAPWVHLPITMGYDRFPERLIDEKKEIFEQLGEGALLLFTHDFEIAAGVLRKDSRGRYGAVDGMSRLDRLDLDTTTG